MTRHVVVVGDALLDIDVETTAERLVPDSAGPVLAETGRRSRPGGAALAATLAAGDPDVRVTLVTALPPGPDTDALRALVDPRIELVDVPATGELGCKTRLRTEGHTVARLDRGGPGVEVSAPPDGLGALLESADCVLVSDYGRGVVHGVLEHLARVARRRPVVWDPHPRGPEPVPGVRVVTPNAAEAARTLDEPVATAPAAACEHARRLVRRWQCTSVAVTLGPRGAVLATGDDAVAALPAPGPVGTDPCGAGDRFAARLATALAAGAVPSSAAAAAVAGATQFLAEGGLLAAERPDEPPAAPSDVAELVAQVRARGGTVVATGGCFDLLHAGHVATLTAARALGDCLVVCLNSDASVRRLKGDQRPVQPEADRRTVLAELAAVDAVVVFEDDTPMSVLRRLQPDIWVKGGDYRSGDLPEAELVRSWGGTVVTVPYLPGRSTTALLEKGALT